MGSPSFFGKLANFTAALRKPGLIPFGTFSPNDNLAFIASFPSAPDSIATITFTPTPTFDTSSGSILGMTLTSNVTSSTFNYAGGMAPTGQEAEIRLTQDATGGRTFALPPNLVYDENFVIDPAPSRTTVLPIRWNGSNWVFRSEPFSIRGL